MLKFTLVERPLTRAMTGQSASGFSAYNFQTRRAEFIMIPRSQYDLKIRDYVLPGPCLDIFDSLVLEGLGTLDAFNVVADMVLKDHISEEEIGSAHE